jgi:hypothetical protein
VGEVEATPGFQGMGKCHVQEETEIVGNLQSPKQVPLALRDGKRTCPTGRGPPSLPCHHPHHQAITRQRTLSGSCRPGQARRLRNELCMDQRASVVTALFLPCPLVRLGEHTPASAPGWSHQPPASL